MVSSNQKYRIEKDSMGPVRVPKEAYYGAQTQRAVENFPVSGYRFGRELIHALGLIKYTSAKANGEIGLLEKTISRAIQKASYEVMQGRWDEQFVIDIFQTGSGTSTHMNANEVIANRANEILGGEKGIYRPVHPNDHVNLCQSSNDIRWLGSGPRCGIGEIHLPETQPGSSMMPGKVNPVIPESMIQVCAQVIGNDSAITLGGLSGHFELNAMIPLIAHNLLESIRLLANGVDNFNLRCIKGLKADQERCEEMIEKSLALVTALVPKIGYDEAARIARKAYRQNKTIRKVLEKEGLFQRRS